MYSRTPTPPPWHYDTEHRQIVTSDGRHLVAVGILDGTLSLDEMDANGCLMAAAPDLIAALGAAREFIQGAQLEMTENRYGVVDQINAAIRKTVAPRRP